uniref:Immunoglobulin domain-containing protein n=1 Tax=Cyprinus carpio TaxID=7962 RepID=A0A8C1UGH5_CYPCA
MEGESVILKPAREIKKDDVIHWQFGDKVQQTVIAELKIETGEIFIYADVADERFRDRLELNKTTGSLTIKNTTTAHSGLYNVQIRSSSGDSQQTFSVTVRVEEILRKGGDSVTLKPATEIQRDDQILWMFGDQYKLIAQIRGGRADIYDDVNKRFRGRLKLDKMTGSLTITDTEAEHSGLYKLQIISSRGTLYKRFKVSIQPRIVEVTPGKPVHLNTGLNEIQTDDEIQWRFGNKNSLIAEIKGGTGVTRDGPNERFRDRLELDKKTGDLIIKNSTAEHTGYYKLKISSSEGNTNRTYSVTIRARFVEVTEGESVRLHTALTKIQTDDEIQWRFGNKNSLIAEIKGGTGVTHDGPDERFRDRLELDEKTGDLIIKNSTYKHTGRYKLKISSSEGKTNSKYTVTIKERKVEVTAGESVRLHTALTEIQTDDEIQWRFGNKNSLIAEIKGGTGVTHDLPNERFRDRLELDEKTGDLIIKNSTAEHTGLYKLKIRSSEGNTYRTYSVTIREVKKKSMKETTDSRRNQVNESVTVEMENDPLLNGEDVNVVNEEEGTSSL